MERLELHLGPLVSEPDPHELIEIKRGRKALGERAMTNAERQAKHKRAKKGERVQRVAILDMETDPFDASTQQEVLPFLGVLYSDDFEPVVVWENDFTIFVDKLVAEILKLPDSYTIYAHNGGKFDFMFLISRIRGRIGFKGRGIMTAKIGNHELRDSYHIIPERLGSYKKDKIDYSVMARGQRDKHRAQIVEYCIADCRYLLDIVKRFLADHGFKLSIGQAALAKLKQEYKVANLSDSADNFLRYFFFGGRVECLAGKGLFNGAYRLYDVNSMYPYAMANFQHPTGKEYIIRRGAVGPNTIFIDLHCKSYGAFVRRGDPLKGEALETFAPHEYGRFKTTIWEYQVAKKYGLISHERINFVIDYFERTDFSRFVLPLYSERQAVKNQLKALKAQGIESGSAFDELKKDDIFLKLLLNNAYGKFAQNPRRFKEHYITDAGEKPPADEGEFDPHPAVMTDHYFIWSRPSPNKRFNNVATAASITGAARAILLEAIQNAIDPIYCDTDSLICRELNNVPIHKSDLGAWDIEKEMDQVIICGKKLYAYRQHGKDETIKSKGASGLTWDNMLRILAGEILEMTNPAPTLTKSGSQDYITRKIRATTKEKLGRKATRNGQHSKGNAGFRRERA